MGLPIWFWLAVLIGSIGFVRFSKKSTLFGLFCGAKIIKDTGFAQMLPNLATFQRHASCNSRDNLTSHPSRQLISASEQSRYLNVASVAKLATSLAPTILFYLNEKLDG